MFGDQLKSLEPQFCKPQARTWWQHPVISRSNNRICQEFSKRDMRNQASMDCNYIIFGYFFGNPTINAIIKHLWGHWVAEAVSSISSCLTPGTPTASAARIRRAPSSREKFFRSQVGWRLQVGRVHKSTAVGVDGNKLNRRISMTQGFPRIRLNK